MENYLDKLELETLQRPVEGGTDVPPTTPTTTTTPSEPYTNTPTSVLDSINLGGTSEVDNVAVVDGEDTSFSSSPKVEHMKHVLANTTARTLSKVNYAIEPFTNWLERDDYTFMDMVSAYNPFDDDNGKTKEELRPYTKIAVDSWAEQEKNLEQFYLENPNIGFLEKFVVGAGSEMLVGAVMFPNGMFNTFNFIKGQSFTQSLARQAGMNMGDAVYENYLQHAFGDEEFSSKVTTGKVATEVGMAGIMPAVISGSIYGTKKVVNKFPNIVNRIRQKTINNGYIESDKSTRDMINDAVSSSMGNKDAFKIKVQGENYSYIAKQDVELNTKSDDVFINKNIVKQVQEDIEGYSQVITDTHDEVERGLKDFIERVKENKQKLSTKTVVSDEEYKYIITERKKAIVDDFNKKSKANAENKEVANELLENYISESTFNKMNKSFDKSIADAESKLAYMNRDMKASVEGVTKFLNQTFEELDEQTVINSPLQKYSLDVKKGSLVHNFRNIKDLTHVELTTRYTSDDYLAFSGKYAYEVGGKPIYTEIGDRFEPLLRVVNERYKESNSRLNVAQELTIDENLKEIGDMLFSKINGQKDRMYNFYLTQTTEKNFDKYLDNLNNRTIISKSTVTNPEYKVSYATQELINMALDSNYKSEDKLINVLMEDHTILESLRKNNVIGNLDAILDSDANEYIVQKKLISQYGKETIENLKFLDKNSTIDGQRVVRANEKGVKQYFSMLNRIEKNPKSVKNGTVFEEQMALRDLMLGSDGQINDITQALNKLSDAEIKNMKLSRDRINRELSIISDYYDITKDTRRETMIFNQVLNKHHIDHYLEDMVDASKKDGLLKSQLGSYTIKTEKGAEFRKFMQELIDKDVFVEKLDLDTPEGYAKAVDLYTRMTFDFKSSRNLAEKSGVGVALHTLYDGELRAPNNNHRYFKDKQAFVRFIETVQDQGVNATKNNRVLVERLLNEDIDGSSLFMTLGTPDKFKAKASVVFKLREELRKRELVLDKGGMSSVQGRTTTKLVNLLEDRLKKDFRMETRKRNALDLLDPVIEATVVKTRGGLGGISEFTANPMVANMTTSQYVGFGNQIKGIAKGEFNSLNDVLNRAVGMAKSQGLESVDDKISRRLLYQSERRINTTDTAYDIGGDILTRNKDRWNETKDLLMLTDKASDINTTYIRTAQIQTQLIDDSVTFDKLPSGLKAMYQKYGITDEKGFNEIRDIFKACMTATDINKTKLFEFADASRKGEIASSIYYNLLDNTQNLSSFRYDKANQGTVRDAVYKLQNVFKTFKRAQGMQAITNLMTYRNSEGYLGSMFLNTGGEEGLKAVKTMASEFLREDLFNMANNLLAGKVEKVTQRVLQSKMDLRRAIQINFEEEFGKREDEDVIDYLDRQILTWDALSHYHSIGTGGMNLGKRFSQGVKSGYSFITDTLGNDTIDTSEKVKRTAFGIANFLTPKSVNPNERSYIGGLLGRVNTILTGEDREDYYIAHKYFGDKKEDVERRQMIINKYKEYGIEPEEDVLDTALILDNDKDNINKTRLSKRIQMEILGLNLENENDINVINNSASEIYNTDNSNIISEYSKNSVVKANMTKIYKEADNEEEFRLATTSVFGKGYDIDYSFENDTQYKEFIALCFYNKIYNFNRDMFIKFKDGDLDLTIPQEDKEWMLKNYDEYKKIYR